MLSVLLMISVIYWVFVCVCILWRFVLETILCLVVLPQYAMRYPEVGHPHTTLPPAVFRFPAVRRSLPPGITQHVKAILKQRWFLMPAPASAKLHQAHCMQLTNFSIKLLLKMISVFKTKSILITNQPKKIRNFIEAIKRDCKNLMTETLSIPNFDVLGSSTTLPLINH